MTAPLKPCPFCGHINGANAVFLHPDRGQFAIICGRCLCEGPTLKENGRPHRLKREAIAAWNRRASSNHPSKWTKSPHTGRNRAGEKEKKDAK